MIDQFRRPANARGGVLTSSGRQAARRLADRLCMHEDAPVAKGGPDLKSKIRILRTKPLQAAELLESRAAGPGTIRIFRTLRKKPLQAARLLESRAGAAGAIRTFRKTPG
jgi:hypothetical protein